MPTRTDSTPALATTPSSAAKAPAQDDTLTGGPGSDRVLGGGGDDLVLGGDGDDFLDGGAGADQLAGEAGNDRLAGRAGPDYLGGGDGSDARGLLRRDGWGVCRPVPTVCRMTASPGEADNIDPDVEGAIGGTDSDVLSGNGGNGVFDGGDGDDRIEPGAGADAVTGGAGFDVVSYASRTAPLRVDSAAPGGDGETGEGDNLYPDVEQVIGRFRHDAAHRYPEREYADRRQRRGSPGRR